jgi:hypothetical protein
MVFNEDHPSYGDMRPLYQVDAARVMTATAEFTIDEDQTYLHNIDVPAEQLMYSFDIHACQSEGYIAFIDIKIRSTKPSAPITVTIGKRPNQVAAVNRLSIDDRYGLPLDPDMPDMPVSLSICIVMSKNNSDLCRSYAIHHNSSNMGQMGYR